MSKPKMLGMKSAYIPNAKADMRHHKKVYQRGREKSFRFQKEIQLPERKEAGDSHGQEARRCSNGLPHGRGT